MIVLVFKTSVHTPEDVVLLKPYLDNTATIHKWNFDLQDIDKILRIESNIDTTSEIINQLTVRGFLCDALP